MTEQGEKGKGDKVAEEDKADKAEIRAGPTAVAAARLQ